MLHHWLSEESRRSVEEDQDLLDEILIKWDRCNELADERKKLCSAAYNQILDFEKTR